MAARFWVGGSGTWDASDTTHWAATSGGAGGQSVPGSSDDVTIDNHASGLNGGTITVNTNPAILSLTMSTMVGTLDFATNNNSPTISGNLSISGTTTRTLNMGSGTWTMSSTGALWQASTVTGLTLDAGTSTIAFTGATGTAASQIRFLGGGKTYSTVTFIGGANQNIIITGNNTIGTLTLAAPARVQFDNTQTITTLTNVTGDASNQLMLENASPLFNGTNSIVLTNNWTGTYCGVSGLAFSGGTATATNSFNFGRNSGITITAPSGGATYVGVIGG